MSDSLWYKDAVIYQLHVRTFADSNGDGIGDFPGLISRLDYLSWLGINCLWLLPFYESPLRDDGYDIAHYERIHPQYGTMEDVERFLAEAHRRGMRVITELVINHTSDRHPWFQAARHAPRGSDKRDFYVWSDTTDRYADARIIFSDAEASNWTWDEAAGQYYWHRFFHHQPDLNFDNAHVRMAVLKVMRFWLDKGVDGLRLDAIAHLYERDGTSCDNLPETHALLKWMRRDLDARYGDRVLLAEANQPPALLREYFGTGDECHMAFHFPLVSRLYAAFADERAAPIIEAIERTRDIPGTAQWAVFLRNHDDLSLSSLGAAENERLMEHYAPHAAMRLHGGIRRRLAPMLNHDRRRIELAYQLLLAVPGSPVLYYGDELGMDDQLDLPDRDGLRTPMPWDVVSKATDDLHSLPHAVAGLLRLRASHPAFGRGTVTFLPQDSPAILAMRREYEDDVVLLVANLSASPQCTTAIPEGANCMAAAAASSVAAGELAAGGHVSLPPYGWGWWAVVPALTGFRRG